MTIQKRRASSAALPPVAGASVVVVVAWAPGVPSPGTRRLAIVVKVRGASTWATCAGVAVSVCVTGAATATDVLVEDVEATGGAVVVVVVEVVLVGHVD